VLDVVEVVGEVTVGDTTVVVGKSVVDVVVLGNSVVLVLGKSVVVGVVALGTSVVVGVVSDVGDELVVVVLASVPVVSDDAAGTEVPAVDDDAVVLPVFTAR
jgi:hypothetical protein